MTVFDLLDKREAAPLSIGPTLKRAREAAGHSVSDIADRMRLSRRNIEDMEAERFDHFPVSVFLRGYLASYARLVGLDPDPLLEEYDRRGFGPPKLHSKNSERTTARGSELTVTVTTVIVVAVLLVLTALWWRDQWTGDDLLPTPETAPEAAGPGEEGGPREGGEGPGGPVAASGPGETPAPEGAAEASDTAPAPDGEGPEGPTEAAPEAAPAPSEAAPATPEAAPSPPGSDEPEAAPAAPEVIADEDAAPAAPGSGEPESGRAGGTAAAGEAERPAAGEGGLASLVIRVREDCWLMIRDADERLIYRDLAPAGTVLDLMARPPVRIVAGYASGIEIEYDGEPFDPLPFVEEDTGTARFRLGA